MVMCCVLHSCWSSCFLIQFIEVPFHSMQELTPDANIVSTRYTKSAIKSCAALSYVEAQARMDDRFLVFLISANTLIINHKYNLIVLSSSLYF